MTRVAHTLSSMSKQLERIAFIIACAGLALMTCCILTQIVARYIFSEPPAWTEELARHAMIWAGFSGATVAYSKKADPVLFRIASLPREWMQRAAQYVEICAVSIFCIAVLAATPTFLALHSQRLTETLEAPSHLIAAIIPLSMSIILFHAFARLINLAFPGPTDRRRDS